MDGYAVSQALCENADRRGLTRHPQSNLGKPSMCGRLEQAVWAKMARIGETDENVALQALIGYNDVLVGKWHGIDVMSDRIIRRWYNTHRTPEGQGTEDGTGDGGEAPGSGDGDGTGSPDGSGPGQRQDGGGDPEGGRGPEEAPGSGIGDGSGEDGPEGGDGSGSGGPQEGEGGQEGQEDPAGGDDGPGGEGDGSEDDGPEGGEDREGDDESETGEDGDPGEETDKDGTGQTEGESECGSDPREPKPEEPEYVFEDGWIPPKGFHDIVVAARMGKNIALYGPAGCGKTDIAIHLAMVLDRPYYITTAPQMPYDLIGFVDGNGVYTETAFSVPFTQGGVAILDEMDRSGPEALIAINAPVANGTMFVPKRGQFAKHPDCLFVATLNTAGLGADMEYVTANQLDASTRDRFVWFRTDYDERVDLICAGGDRKLVDFARDWRQACRRAEIYNSIFSYRVLRDFKDLVQTPEFGVTGAIDKVLLKGADKETCRTIMRYMQHNNVYHKAFRAYVNGMED